MQSRIMFLEVAVLKAEVARGERVGYEETYGCVVYISKRDASPQHKNGFSFECLTT